MIHDPILGWLLTKGNEQGYLTHEDILAALPGAEQDEVSRLDDLLEHLADAGISVLAASPDTEAADAGVTPAANPDGLAVATKADLTEDAGYQQALNTDDVIGLYLKEAGRIPLLTAEQEVSLAKRIEAGEFAQAQLDEYGDQIPLEDRIQIEALLIDATAAEEHLIRANARLVISIAKKYVGRGVPFLDLIQEGNIGLIRAVRKFEYQRGNKFSTYATWWIRQAVSRAVADQGRTIRVPVHLGDQINKLLRISSQLAQELGRDPVIEEIAERLEITPDRATELMAISRRPISLESPTGEEQDAVIGDFIEDEKAPSPPEVVAQQLLSGEINKLLRWLPEREAYILKLRYGLDNGRIHTLEEVGRKIGVTRERVRQLEAQALNRLRHSSALMLRDYLTEE